jgi:hypothetical protein
MSYMEKEKIAREIYEMGHEYCIVRITRYLQTIERLTLELEEHRIQNEADRNNHD